MKLLRKGFSQGLSVKQIMTEITSELNGPGNITKEILYEYYLRGLKQTKS